MNVVICEDDEIYAQRCRDLIKELSFEVGIESAIHIFGDGRRLLFEDEVLRGADVVFLDYHLPEMKGIEVARELRARGLQADIIFLTWDNSHAIEAFDVQALHYIIKGTPDTEEKVARAFLRSVARSAWKRKEVTSFARAGERLNVMIRSILYFEVRKRVVTVHYLCSCERESFSFYSSLSQLEKSLGEKGFVRVHRSYLVNEWMIAKQTAHAVELVTGDIIPVGSTCTDRLEGIEGE